jgi:putative transposase
MMTSEALCGWKWQSLDSVSIKAPLGGKMTGPNPTTDRGKRGTKCHVLVDQKGIPLSVIIITFANTHDMKVITNTLDNVAVKRPSDKQNLCPDKGYDFLEVQRSSIKRRYIPYIHYRY